MDAPRLYRCKGGIMLCGAHKNAVGPAMFHTPQCAKCAEVWAKNAAEGKPQKPDASTLTLRERSRRAYRCGLMGKSRPEELERARARGWAGIRA